MPTPAPASPDTDPVERLVASLPRPIAAAVNWLRRPGLAWVRIPVALLFIVGGVFGFLPILGFWMVPVGLLLLAEDIPWLKPPMRRAIGKVQRWWDRRQARRRAGNAT